MVAPGDLMPSLPRHSVINSLHSLKCQELGFMTHCQIFALRETWAPIKLQLIINFK